MAYLDKASHEVEASPALWRQLEECKKEYDQLVILLTAKQKARLDKVVVNAWDLSM